MFTTKLHSNCNKFDRSLFSATEAKKLIKKLYRPGFQYHKAGIMLLDLLPNSVKQFNLFTPGDNKPNLMAAVDKINRIMGKNSVYFCAEGIKKEWQLKRNKKSPCYTTRLKELVIAYCHK